MSRGSIWRKWDLHIHTPESFHHDFAFENKGEGSMYGGKIWEKYIDKLESLRDCSVLGVTDYFSIDGYKRVLAYRQEGRLTSFELILPNVELRLDKLIQSRKRKTERRLNYHVIFSDKVDPRDIEKEFIEELEITHPLSERRRLNRENIEEIGRILKQQHERWKGDSEYRVGCKNITVSPSQVLEILRDKSSIFRGNYLIALAGDWDNIDWDGQDHLTKKVLLRDADCFLSGNPKTRSWMLGESYESRKSFEDEFGALKPCIHGSDAHDFESLFRPDKERFCWIKAEPTFEGLKQILYEPRERVHIGKECPEPIKSIYSIASFGVANSVIDEQLEIVEQEIPFNQNLVTIIGGKGTGKTALLDLVANCFIDRRSRAGNDPNSFVQRNERDKPDLEVSLTFLDGGRFTKQLTDESLFPSVVTYLPQGKMEEYIADREKLHEKIREIIFEHKDVIESEYRIKWDEVSGEIASSLKNIEDLSFKINQLREEVSNEIADNLRRNKRIKESEIKDLDAKLSQVVSRSGDDSKQKVEKLEQEIGQLRSRILRLRQSRDDLESLQETLAQYQKVNTEINRLNKGFVRMGLQVAIEEFDFESRISAASRAVELIDEEEEECRRKEVELKGELGKMTSKERAHAELLERKEVVKNEHRGIIRQLKILGEKVNQLDKMSKTRVDKFSDLIKKTHQQKQIYRKMIEVFSKGKDQILSGIEFEPSVFFDAITFRERGRPILDFRRASNEQVEELRSHAESLSKDDADIGNLIKDYDRLAQGLRSSIKSKWGELDFDNWVFANYFSLNTEIILNGVHMDKLSMGQKGTVLLKILLAEGEHPLIIDQPEENLDNEFIYEVLVDAFVQAKKKRQIIIATHNANLVVNTDAEQTIIAIYEDNKISYKWGAIENPEIRDGITRLLEGGEEAFIRREQKYGFVEKYA